MANTYTLIRSSRRTLSIQIDKGGQLIVRAPLRYSVVKIEEFLTLKQSWIQKQKKITLERVEKWKRESEYYFLLGETYRRWDLSELEIIELSKDSLRAYLRERVPELAFGKIFQRSIMNIRINSARTRWWSCSSKGNISFSYRLIAFPQETIDAVIIHELAHLNHLNHSKHFWKLVHDWMPEYKNNISPLSTGLTSM